jgi:hypothetical protein
MHWAILLLVLAGCETSTRQDPAPPSAAPPPQDPAPPPAAPPPTRAVPSTVRTIEPFGPPEEGCLEMQSVCRPEHGGDPVCTSAPMPVACGQRARLTSGEWVQCLCPPPPAGASGPLAHGEAVALLRASTIALHTLPGECPALAGDDESRTLGHAVAEIVNADDQSTRCEPAGDGLRCTTRFSQSTGEDEYLVVLEYELDARRAPVPGSFQCMLAG